MSERDGYERGVPCWVATVQPDPDAAARFYGELLGWETEDLMPPDHPGSYFLCTLRGRDVAAVVSQHGAPAPPAAVWTTHVQVDSADEAGAKAKEAGGEVIGEPFDSPGGGRMAVVADPAGAVLCAWEPRERSGAQLVNEPSAWSMSNLVTDDPDGARTFYREVFGWETETFDMGGAEVTLWKVPGYVGGEPEQPVARDVVATMLPPSIAGGGPPRWSVDFWVHDADAVAAKAEELGGTVVTGPYEAGAFRQALLADPQGAEFTVSRLNAGP
ncbi:MAG: VOC family protein [Thermoleophilaceae bacterium]|jgi:uncharacterized protein